MMRICRLLCPRFIAALAFASASALAGDWPQFLGPERRPFVEAEGLNLDWANQPPEVLWRADVEQGFTGPAVHDGEVFLLDRIDNKKDKLRCLSLADGKELWSFEYDAPGRYGYGGSRTTPAVDKNSVYVVGPMGHFHCIDRKTHKQVWKSHLLKDFGAKRPTWAVAQNPLLYKDTVIVAPLGGEAGVVAFDRESGAIAWESKSLGGMQYVSPMLMTEGGVDQVLILGGKKHLAGLDATTGEVLWEYNGWSCSIPITAPLPLGNGYVFVTGGYNAGSALVRVQKDENGEFSVNEVFRNQEIGAQIHVPVVVGKHIYVNSNENSRRNGLACLDIEGNVLWKTGKNPNFERGSLLQIGDLALGLDGNGGKLHLFAPNPEGYRELASVNVLQGSQVWAPMAVADGRLLIRDQKTLVCLDLQK
ncbi:MAG: PQQ-binding-like beta-propeller repeat protein [Verrucomicrobiota bacterium]